MNNVVWFFYREFNISCTNEYIRNKLRMIHKLILQKHLNSYGVNPSDLNHYLL